MRDISRTVELARG